MTTENQEVRVRKLANLDQRIARWEAQKKQNLKEVLTSAVSVLITVFLLMYGLTYVTEVAFNLYQLGKSMVIFAILMVPLIFVQLILPYGRKPTQADVDDDIELRKYFEMDSRVND